MTRSVSTGLIAKGRAEPPFSPPCRVTLKDGTVVGIRAIQPTDTEMERTFIERLSPTARRYRFLASIKTPSAELLRQLTQPELTQGVAYVALIGEGAETQEIGVCRYSAGADGASCECAVTVADAWQHKGLATILMQRLVATARAHGFERMYSIDASANEDMRQLARHLGFSSETDPEDSTLVIHTLTL